jgi:hypothetical protein
VSSGALPLIGWGLALIAIAIFGATVFGLDPLPALLLAGAGATCIAVAGATQVAAGRRPAAAVGTPDLLLRSSAATLVVTVGVTLAFVGALIVAPALLWPGNGLIVIGAAGLVRELRAQRRLRDGAGA